MENSIQYDVFAFGMLVRAMLWKGMSVYQDRSVGEIMSMLEQYIIGKDQAK